jgi:hypothetical protein
MGDPTSVKVWVEVKSAAIMFVRVCIDVNVLSCYVAKFVVSICTVAPFTFLHFRPSFLQRWRPSMAFHSRARY